MEEKECDGKRKRGKRSTEKKAKRESESAGVSEERSPRLSQ